MTARYTSPGGACQCDRCMMKTPSDGFYHAPASDHQRDAAIRTELEYDTERRIGFDPKVGNPALDNTIERQRSPEALQALLEGTRKAYPRVFKPHAEAAE